MTEPRERSGIASAKDGEAKRARKRAYELALKPGLGKAGDAAALRANYFKLKRWPQEAPLLYEIDIQPGKISCDANGKPRTDKNGNKKWEKVTQTRIALSPGTNRRVIARLVLLYRDNVFKGSLPTYDGMKLLYARGALAFEERGESSTELLVDLPEERNDKGEKTANEKRFYVTLTRPADSAINFEVLREALAGRERIVPQNAVSSLETVLKQRLATELKVVGQSFFDPSQSPSDLGGGVEAWTGFHQSLRAIMGAAAAPSRPQEGALALNIDTAVTAFVRPQSAIEFVAGEMQLSVEQLRRGPKLKPDEIQKVERTMKGLTVETIHLNFNKKMRVQKISSQAVGDIRFMWVKKKKKQGPGNKTPTDLEPSAEEAKEVSVTEYFKQMYGRDLQFAHLPAFMSGRDFAVATPLEVCRIAKGNRVKKLTEIQTSAMIRKAAQAPSERRKETEQIVLANKYNEDPLVREWGLEGSPEMMCVAGRVLPAPELLYANEQIVRNRPGSWNLVPSNRPIIQMFKSKDIDSWAVLNFAAAEPRFRAISAQQARAIAQRLHREGSNFGLSMAPLRPYALISSDPRNSREGIRKAATLRPRPRFVLVILPAGKIPLYAELKRECEVALEGALVKQCCSADKILDAVVKNKQQYFANLVQKINTKTVLMGADVSHAPGHRADVPSVAAVVGSFNTPVPTMYQAEVSAQRPRQEIISNLFVEGRCWNAAARSWAQPPGGAVRNLLKAFYFYERNGGREPQRIVFFWDGVSDGQFQNVLDEKVAAIKKACQSLRTGFDPPLTYIVVQKRHKTRFYPENRRDGNIKPGTVVDSDVSHPSLFDFFLCSHQGIQGTNRPVHYYVLYDDNNFTPEEIQRLTNDLTYTYAACTRSISVAPPAYYADLAATRARLYMQEDWDKDSVSSGEGGEDDTWQAYKMPSVQDALKQSMVFC